MDLSKQLENNEQRCRYGSVGTLTRVMPGEQYLESGQHTICAIPEGSVIESYSVIAEGWDSDIVVNIGTVSSPTQFFNDTLVDGVIAVNEQDVPIELYTPVMVPVVCEIVSGNAGEQGTLEFAIQYSELDTTAGAYTS